MRKNNPATKINIIGLGKFGNTCIEKIIAQKRFSEKSLTDAERGWIGYYNFLGNDLYSGVVPIRLKDGVCLARGWRRSRRPGAEIVNSFKTQPFELG